jgi:hypothetical protein
LKRSLLAAALAGVALVSNPFEARAQLATVAKPFQIGIAAGAAIPISDLADEVSTGFNVTGVVGFNPALIPLGVRIDAAYNRFALKNGVDGNESFISVTGNLLYKFPSQTISPYAIGGAGWCRFTVDVSGQGSASDNHFCWNLGGGLSMPLSGFDTFIEARYTQVQGDAGSAKFVPITFGVMF